MLSLKEKINKQKLKTKSWFEKNEKYLTIGFFLAGLVIDNLTLTRIDRLYDNLIIISYLCIAVFSIILINLAQTKKIIKNAPRFVNFSRYLPLASQFAYGGLFSAYIIFYTKSASWATSWIFLLIIFGLFLGNERFRKQYKEIDFQINILFLALFSFMIFFVPVILKKMGDWIFILSGVLSVILIWLLIKFISRFILKINPKKKKKMITHITGVFIIFNLMYFLNVIPPVPLSIKEIGVYRNIQKTKDGNYLFKEVEVPWYSFGNRFIEISKGTVYVYSSIFAPTDLNTKIIYEWQKYSESKREWVGYGEIDYPITGGRKDGYRGFVYASNLSTGDWRVSIKTKSDLTVGRIKFEIID